MAGATKKRPYTPQKVDTQVFSKALSVWWQEVDNLPTRRRGYRAARRYPARQVRNKALVHFRRPIEPLWESSPQTMTGG